MSKQVIEYRGLPVGIVVPDEGRLRFIAVKFNVHDLDGHSFGSQAEVLKAIHTLLGRTGDSSRAA
jgi:hypothetical protein